MDGREGMTIPGSVSYYMQQRGLGGSGAQPGLHGQAGIRPLSGSAYSTIQSNIRIGVSTYPVESSATTTVSPHGVGMGMGMPSGIGSGEPVKRKRGRPRKYGPDGRVVLALSPSTSSTPVVPVQKRGRGRPPGSGKKQQLASLGEWVAGSAGMGFTPHVITVPAGEDIASKIMSFSQQGPRAVCILSASGSVSSVTLRQPSTSCGTVTYEGRFEIVCLSGSYLLSEDGGTRSRTGGLSVSLGSPDGRVIGGVVAGLLIASTPIQVIIGSFSYRSRKPQPKQGSGDQVQEESGLDSNVGMLDKPGSSAGAVHYQNPGGLPGRMACTSIHGC